MVKDIPVVKDAKRWRKEHRHRFINQNSATT